jgi:hypothetical protein
MMSFSVKLPVSILATASESPGWSLASSALIRTSALSSSWV